MTNSPKEAQEMPEKVHISLNADGTFSVSVPPYPEWFNGLMGLVVGGYYIPEAKYRRAVEALKKIEWETRGITLAETLNRIATESLRELGEL